MCQLVISLLRSQKLQSESTLEKKMLFCSVLPAQESRQQLPG
jgi:hypothetical protein